MKTLVKKTEDTPLVTIDESGTLKFEGHSFPFDALPIYEPVIKEVKERVRNSESTRMIIEIDYFNTVSKKIFYHLFKLIESQKDSAVVWRYEEDDEEILELGEIFKSQVRVKFELEQIKIEP